MSEVVKLEDYLIIDTKENLSLNKVLRYLKKAKERGYKGLAVTNISDELRLELYNKKRYNSTVIRVHYLGGFMLDYYIIYKRDEY